MKQYPPISVLARSGDYWRVFITQSFSIRPIVNYLQRFNPSYSIVYVKYGYFPSEIQPTNTKWTELTPEEVLQMTEIITEDEMFEPIPDMPNFKEYLLANYDYRTALSTYYWYTANYSIYPSKAPFSGVENYDIPDDIYELVGPCDHLFFISDDDNPLENSWDILRWYEGRRISRRINGVLVEGYLLSGPRFEIEDEDEE